MKAMMVGVQHEVVSPAGIKIYQEIFERLWKSGFWPSKRMEKRINK